MMKINDNKGLEVVSIRLVKDKPLLSDTSISTPADAIELLGKQLCELDREVLCVINLSADNKPINCNFVSMGTVNQTMACPKDILKSTILSNAARMILLHNHTSGNLLPSKDDINVTDKMLQISSIIGVPLIDHVIVGGENKDYFSFKEKRILHMSTIPQKQDYNELEFPSIDMVAEKGRSR